MTQERNVVVACGVGSSGCGWRRVAVENKVNVVAFCLSMSYTLADGLRSF